MNVSRSQYAWDNVYTVLRTRCTEVWTRLIGKVNSSHTFQKQRVALSFVVFLIPEYLGRLPDCGATPPVADVGFLWTPLLPTCSRKTLCAPIAFILLSSVISSPHFETVLLTLHGRKNVFPNRRLSVLWIEEHMRHSVFVSSRSPGMAHTPITAVWILMTMGLGPKGVCFVLFVRKLVCIAHL